MPSRRLPDGTFKDIAHPINQETREMLEKFILENYNKVAAQANNTVEGPELGTEEEANPVAVEDDIHSPPPESASPETLEESDDEENNLSPDTGD